MQRGLSLVELLVGLAVGLLVIASANVGCITHLQSGTGTAVRHWIELVDAALP